MFNFIKNGFGKGKGKGSRKCCENQQCTGKGMGKNCCTLNDLNTGCKALIRRHHGWGAVRQRLLDLGFVPGSLVDVIRSAPLKDPIQLKIGNDHISIRREEAAQIEVEPVA
jgi:ferrous iron transport protein A